MGHNVHIPRKRFGQHFLCDPGVIEHIIASIAPDSSQHVIEIGPGQGALTLPLLKLLGHLEVVELDRDLIPVLQERAAGLGELTLHAADALTFDFGALKKNDKSLRIIGNLPYNISTPLIFHLLTFSEQISDMTFMLQKEVAERLAASTNNHHYGRLSVMTQYHCRVELLFNVPPSAFYPPPKVQSSIVRLVPHQTNPYQLKNAAIFSELVKTAFGMRRKTLRNSLRHMVTEQQWAEVNIASTLRAENLSVQQFVELSNVIG